MYEELRGSGMEKKKIFFGSVEKALEFVECASKTDAEIRLISGTSIVNGKSLLGVLSLNLTEPITLEIRGDVNSSLNAIKTLNNYIQ